MGPLAHVYTSENSGNPKPETRKLIFRSKTPPPPPSRGGEGNASLAHHPPALFARQLRVRAVVFLWVLDGRDTVHGRGALELDAFLAAAGGACECLRLRLRLLVLLFLEDALGRARIGVAVGLWGLHLHGRKALPCGAGGHRRDWGAGESGGGFEGEGGPGEGLGGRDDQRELGFGVHVELGERRVID